MAGIYDEFAAVVVELLKEFGAQTMWERPASAQIIDGEEVSTPMESGTVLGVRSKWSWSERQNATIQQTDIKFVTDAERDIKIGDLIILNGLRLRAENATPIEPIEGKRLAYILQLRA